MLEPSNGAPPPAPAPSGQQVPAPVLLKIFNMLTAYLLYERREETKLQLAFITLVRERHAHFHAKQDVKDVDANAWMECGNAVCKEAKVIIEEGRKPEVEVLPLSAELMGQYDVAINPTNQRLKAVLVEKSDHRIQRVQPGPPAATIPAPDRPTGKLILEV